MDGLLSSSVEIMSLPRGLYVFTVKSAAPSLAGLDGKMVLPGLHVGLCPGGSRETVEFVSAPGASDFWLYKPDDVMVVRVLSESLPLLLTSVRVDQTAPLDVEVQRLGDSGQSMVAPEPLSPNAFEDSKRRSLRTQVIAHVQNRGDLTFIDEAWAGLLNQRLWIEAFEIVPRERLQPDQIEYKALDAAGGETPWIKGGETCGTRGLGVPLLGFAVRLSPTAAVQFDVEYVGKFVSGQTVGPLKSGAPIFSPSRGDPLECIHLSIVPTKSEIVSEVSPEAAAKVAKTKRRKSGPRFGVFREDAA